MANGKMASKITFRPTQEMAELINGIGKETGLNKSEIMRNIIADYISFVRKSKV